MLEQTSSRLQPSSAMRSNLRSARAKLRSRISGGMPSKSRNGWNVMISSPRSATIARMSAGVPLNDSRSFSKISTPLKPASAIAASFSARSPLSDTDAIASFIGPLSPWRPCLPPICMAVMIFATRRDELRARKVLHAYFSIMHPGQPRGLAHCPGEAVRAKSPPSILVFDVMLRESGASSNPQTTAGSRTCQKANSDGYWVARSSRATT